MKQSSSSFELSPKRKALLEALLQQDGIEYQAREEISGQELGKQTTRKAGSFPLSFAQERIWFLDRLMPGNPVYNLSSDWRFTYAVDFATLQQSLDGMVRRHESLRTTFSSVNGEPVQIVATSLKITLPVVDLRDLPETGREAEALRLATTEAQRPFDLERGPLVRTTLLRMRDEEYIFLLTMHHIVSDGWSLGLFWSELLAIWTAFDNGEPSPLPDLKIQYTDFAVWQRNWLTGKVLETQLKYWKKQLANLSVLQLPTDRPRPPVQTAHGATYEITLPFRLSAALKILSQEEGVTLFMILLAAFQTLLFRYSGQDDIAVGTFIANRNRAETEGLIGLFVNTLVLRTDFGPRPSFRELLREVRETTIEAYGHQDLPFARLVQEIQPERDLSRNPLFQVAFQLLNVPPMSQDGVDSESDSSFPTLGVQRGTAIFDLTFSLWESADGLAGEIEYNSDLFSSDTVKRLAAHYQNLLSGVATDPDRRVHDLPLLSDAELQQLLSDWNATEAEYPRNACIHELFEAQAARSPEAMALACEGKQLSYRELNRRANQLGRYLRALGVGPEMRVGICMHRSMEMVVGLLAILKAGGAYVPLDPAWPKERLAFMVNDGSLDILLTQELLRARLPENGVRFVCLDRWSAVGDESGDNLAIRVTPDNLAYVIYTSGSTGRPKGVLGLHRGAVNRFAWMSKAYPFQAGEVCCARTSLSFVDSVQEIFGSLLGGVPNVIIPDDQMKDIHQLVETLERYHVTRIVLVPSLLAAILDRFDDLGTRLPELQYWITSGEAISAELWGRFQEIVPHGRLINLYGSSEVAGDATCFDIGAGAPRVTVPIGRPISNVQTYIVDRHLRPVPVGVAGELLIGGDALARGYHNLPELTAERFILNPFADGRGGRLFRTGDVAKFLPDGNIEFIGRTDQQVKIRGYRIELGEVEAALSRHEGVRQAVVVASEDDSRDRRLLAYVVPNPDYVGTASQDTPAVGSPEQLPGWQEVWDETYRQAPTQEDPEFNINGWDSGYTGLPIPAEEMREWVEQAAERVRDLQPGSVLDIGAGSGLLLFRLAPHCTRYWGTDFSAAALSYIERQLAKRNLPQVTLLQRSAEDFGGLEPDSFDAVVLNSVAQYFPTVDYLVKVLEGAVNVVRPGGSIFVGDVRSLPLMEVFHTSVELHRAPASRPASKLQHSVWKRLDEVEQLCIDPRFFFALQQHLPQISHVRIEPKRGRYHNELTRFRYEVILRVKSTKLETAADAWLDWKKEGLSLSALRQMLRDGTQDRLGIANIPNARLTGEIKAWELLANSDGLETAGEIRNALRTSGRMGVDPESMYSLADETSRAVRLHWAGPGADDRFHALFRRRGVAAAEAAQGPAFPLAKDSLKHWSAYANNPQKRIHVRWLASELRRFLLTKLPDHMVPAAFVKLDFLPLTPNGKLDRRALPALDSTTPAIQTTYVVPRTPNEEILAGMWVQFLGIERAGAHDNFFELGGHSLLAIRVLSRIREAFDVDLPLRAFLETPTIAGLAQLLEESQARGETNKTQKIVPVPRDAHIAKLLPGGELDPADLLKGRRRETRAASAGH
jgi:amino acid adenylation domain-containing protein